MKVPGHVDVVDSHEVSGWALEAGSNTPDRVVIYVDNREVAQIPCNLPRPDLPRLGLGSGYGGFRYQFAESIGAVGPQKVLVRALSSGEVVPRVVGAEVEYAGAIVTSAKSPLRDAAFIKPTYATDARSIIAGTDDVPGVGLRHGSERKHFVVAASALAPLDAVIGVAPARDLVGVAIGKLESSDAPLAYLPEGAPNFRDIRFEMTVTAPPQRRYVALNLIDLNPDSPCWGCNPIDPIACMCVPLEYNWVTNALDVKNIEHTCGPAGAPKEELREAFWIAGLTAAYQIHSLASEFLNAQKPLTILDWGIGCGRVAVPFKRCINPDATVIGVDVDRMNADWCRKNLPDIAVSLSDFFPPLEFETSSFDLIYGISVMTHLTEGAQYAWLKELGRILKPGGICVLTTHGEYALLRRWDSIREYGQIDRLDQLVIKQLSLIGISDIVMDGNLGPQLEMKKYYRGTFQLRRHVEEQWSRFFKIVGYYPAGLQVFQDMVVMQKE